MGSPLNTRGSQISYTVSLHSHSAAIILTLNSNNMHEAEVLSCLWLMLLIWSKTLSKIFSEVKFTLTPLMTALIISLNLIKVSLIYLQKSSRRIFGETKADIVGAVASKSLSLSPDFRDR
ncbi:hypothetical protein AMECASPLE_039369 [Ameca splendens]|uniref:Uncharacterized protein n=1 Tax=Ameca splendens TaxID=208324 RepID=A0ABV0XXE2_9TELE